LNLPRRECPALLETCADEFWSGSTSVFAFIASLISFSVIASLFVVFQKMLPETESSR